MRHMNASLAHSLFNELSASRFDSAKALAYAVAEGDESLLEPELIAWKDNLTAMESPELQGCSGPDAWHDYGVTHGGRLEVAIDGNTTFIFTESSAFDTYEHFGHGPFVNLRDKDGTEMICRIGGTSCVPLDDWSSKLT